MYHVHHTPKWSKIYEGRERGREEQKEKKGKKKEGKRGRLDLKKEKKITHG